ncbi:Sensory/regulatory protein RpfC [uncultured Ruminococcus sp.]|uniref:hybrid sensor histidine kinase/response regulator n=1 Tax=Huintestinicola butyrica TaxID=2981728 RepID=UPI00082046FE|nr:ATP-binding protein [Huintestinicola butyrica]MCU6728476.1 ATP-binding protein [Huintestinicola butyrica]SCJ15452.1 Sensory/regulatory protein RpfC [uncultured Ruminococcus sp.]
MNGKSEKVHGKSMLSKVMIPMLILGILEVAVFAIVMLVSGELTYIKKYSYNLLIEKTANRASYVEYMLNQKTSPVYETAVEINHITEEYLDENGITLDQLSEDKEVNKELLIRSSDAIVSLIRRDMVNDAFIILDTGSLYDTDTDTVRAGLYLRDTDAYENSTTDIKDIYMEMGSSDIAHELGTALDSEWAPHLVINDDNDFSFYTVPMESKELYPDKPVYNLGYWSGFSKISPSAQKSMKYTFPLVSSDGRVYGVVGIGLMEKTILKNIPANDFFNESACYIISSDIEGDGIYTPELHSGPIYTRLVSADTVFDENADNSYGIYEFAAGHKSSSLGCIQRMNIYNSGSPYNQQHWALISAADKSGILSIYWFLINVFIISVSITVVCGIAFSFYTGRKISKPVAAMINTLNNAQQNEGALLNFGNSGITEIDRLASAIVQLQVSANEYASRVSRIITLTDSKIGVFMVNMRAHTVFVSESLTRIMDFDDIPHSDITVSEEIFSHQFEKIDTDGKILEQYCDAASVPESGSSVEIKREKNGKEVWYKITLSTLNKDVIGLVQDISETVAEKKKIAEYKDNEYTEKLLKANRALRDAYENARRADNAKTDFLSRMSHDIRTPMNAIVGMTVIANSHIDDKEKVADCLEKISVSGNYLLSILNDVLDMSKIESGKFELIEDKIDLNALLDSLLEMVKPDAKAKDHQIIMHKHDIVHPTVIGDGLRIQQMFVNIVSNSVKYTNNGGTITIDVTEKPVGNKNVGCYEFVFKDNGIGMSEEFLKNIFEPFERADDERVNKQQGTGLGMAITYNLVKMMNGDIQVKSKPGKGTVFTVTLFLKFGGNGGNALPTALTPSSKNVDNLKKAHFKDKRVLLVDDNELNREIAGELLEMTGITVEMAENGQEAVDKFLASKAGYYGLIFMDIQMPVMNGYNAALTIRSQPRADARTIPIIAMTADAFAEDVKKARSSGMDEHIAKPLDIDKLVKVLQKWLS